MLDRQRGSVCSTRLHAPDPGSQKNNSAAKHTLRKRVPACSMRPIRVALIEDGRRLIVSPRCDRQPRLNIVSFRRRLSVRGPQVSNVVPAVRAVQFTHDIKFISLVASISDKTPTLKTPETSEKSTPSDTVTSDYNYQLHCGHTHPQPDSTKDVSQVSLGTES